MPDLRGGVYQYAEGEIKPWDKPEHVKAEGKKGHKPLSEYNLPRWVFHPELPTKMKRITKEDYNGCAIGGTGNHENWNVAHVAASHDDLRMFELATKEDMNTPTKFGMLPAHFAAVGGDYCRPCLNVLYRLVEEGADVESKNIQNRTPLELAEDHLIAEDIKAVQRVLKGNKPKDYDIYLAESQIGRRPKYTGKQEPADKPAPVAGETLPVGLLFPGQGSQYVKMLNDDKDHPVVKKMLETAKEILGYDLLDICLNGPEAKLEETRYCQPAMYVAGLAALAKLREKEQGKVDNCQCVAGLSLGEYSALTAAGVFTFAEGLKLVQVRGEAMQEAALATPQGMLSIAGLEEKQIRDCIAKVKTPGTVAEIANFLFPKGYACSGTMSVMQALEGEAKKAGALQAKMLKTSGAFHTSLMQPAQVKLNKALQEALPTMKPPKCTVYMNVTGKAIPAGTPPKDFVNLLGDQLCSGVLWEPSVKAMMADGVKEFYECGPQKQLKAMMKRIDNTAHGATTNVPV